MTTRSADPALRWARTTPGPVTLGEAQARLVRSNPLLAQAVVASARKRRPRARDQAVAPGARKGGWQRWGVRRRALWVVLLLLPVLAVFTVPSRHSRSPESAQLFFDVTFGTYVAAAALQAVLLVAWVLRPLLWEATRVLSAWITLAMVFVVPLLLLTVGALRGSENWLQHTIPVPIASLLAAANLGAAFSDRTRRHHEVQDLAWFEALLDVPEAADRDRPRSPARELRRTIRRLPESSQERLAKRCARVLEILDERGLVSGVDAAQAAATPLGRWHDLD